MSDRSDMIHALLGTLQGWISAMDGRSGRDQSAANDPRHQVLTDSKAQTVRNNLERLFQEEARCRSRWVWELLQNASDVSSAQGARVWAYA